MAKRKQRWKPLRSGLEREIHEQLTKSGIKFEYEPYKIPYRRRVVMGVCGKCGEFNVYQRQNYLPDFVLENGVVIEVKGRLTARDRSKLLAVKSQHPEIDLRIIFGANNKLNKNKPKRYMNWASENNIKAAIKMIPESWLR